MTKQVLFIHGAGEGAHEADHKLAQSLQAALGTDYNMVCPKMPNEDAPEYVVWRDQITQELDAFSGSAILVGHSFGGSVVLKYLYEEPPVKPVDGVFLIATPYWGAEDWEVDEYALDEGFASRLPKAPLFLYHSRDDEIVPFDHLAMYAEKLPQATIHEFDGRGHQFNDDLAEVAADIEGLKHG